jgi:hypothetical protein
LIDPATLDADHSGRHAIILSDANDNITTVGIREGADVCSQTFPRVVLGPIRLEIDVAIFSPLGVNQRLNVRFVDCVECDWYHSIPIPRFCRIAFSFNSLPRTSIEGLRRAGRKRHSPASGDYRLWRGGAGSRRGQ